MRLPIWNKILCKLQFFLRQLSHLSEISFGQTHKVSLESPESICMSSQSQFVRIAASSFGLGLFLMLSVTAFAQTNYYGTNGTEYAIAGLLPGDQVFPNVALNSTGGFVVWQDNVTDGKGWGISAMKINSTLSGTLSPFRVNVADTNDQENAKVALLKNGGAVFVWQGGVEGYQHIYAQFLSSSNTFLTTTDILVSAFASPASFQVNPAVAVLNNSNVVVVWGSYDQAGSNSLQDVYAKILSPTGLTVSNEFLVNQFTNFNQRTPAVTALAGGGFVIAWVSEQERQALSSLDNSFYVAGGAASVSSNEDIIATNYSYYTAAPQTASVDIYARLYQASGAPIGNEFLVNNNFDYCANPALAAASDGSFIISWSGLDPLNVTNDWDVYARPYSATDIAGNQVRVNTYIPNSQYAPQVSAIGLDYLIVWTSINEDGSSLGVYGQLVHNDGTFVGGEFRVNTTTVGPQMQPVVASDGVSQFLAIWTSFTGSPYGMDLYAQRYVNVAEVLQPMSTPNVWAPFTLSNNVYQPQLVVSWPSLLGISVSNFEVYVDGATSPAGLTATNSWTMTAANGLSTNSTHSFTVDYVTTAGGRSPQSPSASGTTWSGLNWGGIPYEWMAEYFGGYSPTTGKYTTRFWQPASSALAPNVTLLGVFMSGGNPLDSTTWLTSSVVQTSQGMFLAWNTQPGLTYQVQQTTNFTSWSNVGAPRYAAGTSDSIYIGGNAAGFYRIQCLNQ